MKCSTNSGSKVVDEAHVRQPGSSFIQWVILLDQHCANAALKAKITLLYFTVWFVSEYFNEGSPRCWKEKTCSCYCSYFCLCCCLLVGRWCGHCCYPAVSDCAGCDCFRHSIRLQTWDHCPRWGNSPYRLPHQRLRGGNPQNQPKGWEKTSAKRTVNLLKDESLHIFFILSSRFIKWHHHILSLHRSGHRPRSTWWLGHPKRF